MRGKPIQWLMAVSAVSGLVWLAGLAWTLQDYFGGSAVAALPQSSPAAAEPEQAAPAAADDGTYRVLALGDSLTRGFGDSEGKGYAGYTVDLLKEKADRDIVLDNLGVNGQTSGQLAALLQKKDVQEKAKAADALLVSIGGNDLFRGGETLVNLDLKTIAGIEAEYTRQLQTILSKLRELNPNANIYLIGLYNPFIELRDSATTSKIVRDWNYNTAETASAYPKTVFVPTFDLFQLHVRDYLFTDRFHPNAEGYRLIAERVASLIKLQGASG